MSSLATDSTEALVFRPPAPAPSPTRLGPIRLLQALRRNPLECWSEDFFREPISRVGLPIGRVFVLDDPLAIRHVLVDNSGNYRKDPLQRRVLSAGLSDGPLSAEDKRWEIQRRTLAPLFSARTVRGLTRDMLQAVDQLSQRWLSLGPGAVVDIAAEITLLTLNVLALTIFSDGLQSDPDEFRLSMTEYFRVAGRIGLLDLIGAPDYIPRPGRWRIKATLKYFEGIIDDLINARRRALETNGPACRDDLLTLLLRALDPATGQPMTLAEVRSNILTFLSVGHETTANTLTWSLFLLSQSDHWRPRPGRGRARVQGSGGRSGRPPGRSQGRHRGSAAAVSADRGAQPFRQGAGPDRRTRHQRWIADRDRALRAASAPQALASARRLRSRAVSG